MEADEYNRKTIDFGNGMLEVVTFHEPQVRLIGSGHRGGLNGNSVISDEAQAQRTKKQIYAIKRRIKGYALANPFKWFATLTIDPKQFNSLNYEIAKTSLLKWCRWMRDTYEKFDYLIVPEFHKSGAVHFHALFGDVPANFVEAINMKTGQPVVRNNREVYNLTDWKYGFSDCEKVISRAKTASYITKYITKDLMTGKDMFGKKRYFNSQGLKAPTVRFEMSDNNSLNKFMPNYGIVETDENGNNQLSKAVYKLQIDPRTNIIIQTDENYLLKAKENTSLFTDPNE